MEANKTKNGTTAYPAVEVCDLTKRFIIHHQGSLKRAITNIGRKQSVERFTALENISFRIPHGQSVAVIGRNGSGKSTLLSLLAGVYKPTTGTVKLYSEEGGRARIAPLLELGAGFHMDLTGLENIEFYGALLGMSTREVREKTESIIAFSELAGKVDTPLRNWNDGAKLRLGFAIAVSTDPDILLVDEVLAVGDAAFQEKCRQRIFEMKAQGKTIVFVSHDLRAVELIADRVIWLNMAKMERDGDTATVLQEYRARSVVPR